MSTTVCSECGATNQQQAKFCTSCGAPQAAVCPGCGAEVQPGAKFCGECGIKLGTGTGTGVGVGTGVGTGVSVEPEPERSAGEERGLSEERRIATVLFADLSGYTAVSERLDPEDTKALVDQVLGRLSREVVDHGGRVDKYIGDNVMAVFGAPVAHEDDPERAVRTGLAMQAAMSEINAGIRDRSATRDVEFALRVGINTGEVLAGTSGDSYTVIGDTVNVAARLQAAGAKGSVTVGPSTHRLTSDAIEFRELEPFELKGKTEPMPAWEAVRIRAGGPPAHPERPAARLIGRDEELALLVSLFDRVAREGRPHLVTVFGEAGVGKSRLLEELAATLSARADEPETLIGRSPAYGTATSYAALGEIIRMRLGISDADEAEEVLRKLTERIAELQPRAEAAETGRMAAQIGRAMGIEARDEAEDGADPEGTRDRIFTAVRVLLELVAEGSPMVVAIEDIHWADEGMLDLVEHLASWVQGPVLMICLARDELLERRPGWGGGRRNVTTISLDPLSAGEAEELVLSLFPDRQASSELAGEVADRSGGNPLFAEEMVNRLREEGSDDVGELPDSVHAVLAARLDALGASERGLLQTASVLGQTFSEGTMAVLYDGGEVGAMLPALVAKDLILPAGAGPVAGDREFVFKHALVRDVAYSTLPRAVRARQHARVAEVLEERSGPNRESVAALLAEHHGRAAELAERASFPPEELTRLRSRAAHASASAGDVAASLYSNAEALSHYELALALPGGLDEAESARVEESRGDTALRSGQVDLALDSWTRALAARDAAGDLARSGELHRKIGSGHWQRGDRAASIANFQQGIDLLKDGDPCRELVELYEEAASLYLETGDNMLAVYAAEKAQRLSESLGQSATASRANLTFGRVFGRIGDVERARQSLERSVELARDASPSEAIRALTALVRHLETAEADYPAARMAAEEALALAEELGDVPAQVELHAALGQLASHSASWPELDRHASAAETLVERGGLSGQRCLPLLLRGVFAWHLGDLANAQDRLRRSNEIAAAGGRSEVAYTGMLWLGACRRDAEEYEDGVAALEQAVEICDRAGLTVQHAEGSAARAAVLADDGRAEEATAIAAEVEARLRDRPAHPVVIAAAAEARGMTAGEVGSAIDELRESAAGWEAAGRPLNAVRAHIALARVLAEQEPATGAELLEATVAQADRLEAPLLAEAGRRELARS